MTTYKVSKLTGSLLDAAVAIAEGAKAAGGIRSPFPHWIFPDGRIALMSAYRPSGEWWRAGEIIERERLCIYWQHDVWVAGYQIEAENGAQISDVSGWDAATIEFRGCAASASQPLVAAMRAYVASKFGETVELT